MEGRGAFVSRGVVKHRDEDVSGILVGLGAVGPDDGGLSGGDALESVFDGLAGDESADLGIALLVDDLVTLLAVLADGEEGYADETTVGLEGFSGLLDGLAGDDLGVGVGLGLGLEVLVLGVQELLDLLDGLVHGDESLSRAVAADNADLRLLKVLGADLEAEGDSLHLPVVELLSGGLVSVVQEDGDASVLQLLLPFLSSGDDGRLLTLEDEGSDDNLVLGDNRGQDESLVVSVLSEGACEHTGGNSVAGHVGELGLVLLSQELDIEGLGEDLTQVVGSDGLEDLSGGQDAIQNIGVLSAGKLVPLGAAKANSVDSEAVVQKIQVRLPGGLQVVDGLLARAVAGVGLVPVDLTSADQGKGILEIVKERQTVMRDAAEIQQGSG